MIINTNTVRAIFQPWVLSVGAGLYIQRQIFSQLSAQVMTITQLAEQL